jgi:hypothetical protein
LVPELRELAFEPLAYDILSLSGDLAFQPGYGLHGHGHAWLRLAAQPRLVLGDRERLPALPKVGIELCPIAPGALKSSQAEATPPR